MSTYVEESNFSDAETMTEPANTFRCGNEEVAEVKEEPVVEKPKKEKKPRTEKQKAAFEKARKQLAANNKRKKAPKKVEWDITSERKETSEKGGKKDTSEKGGKEEEVEPPLWFRKFVQQQVSSKKYKKSTNLLTVTPGSHYQTTIKKEEVVPQYIPEPQPVYNPAPSLPKNFSTSRTSYVSKIFPKKGK